MSCPHPESRKRTYLIGHLEIPRRICLDCRKADDDKRKDGPVGKAYTTLANIHIVRNPGSTLRERELFLQDWKIKQSNPATRDWRAWLFDITPNIPISRPERDHGLDRLFSLVAYNQEDPDDYLF